MPYAMTKELPDAVKKLPEHKQKIFMAAFNSAHQQYGSDEKAFKVAWAAIQDHKEEGRRDFSFMQSLEEAAGGAVLDEANGIIKGVVLLTGKKTSHNRTRYLDSAVQEAVTRYEGAKMFVDHPTKADLEQRKGNRSVRDLAGTFRNVRREGDKVVADAHVLEHHRAWVLPIAKARPAGVGLSIRDRGQTSKDKDGVTLVEGFEPGAMFSVDLVSEVSLNTDLFEGRNETEGGDMELKDVTVEILTEKRPDLIEAIKAPVVKELGEARTELTGIKAREMESRKMAALAEAKLPAAVDSVVKGLISKVEVTLEEAQKIVADHAKMTKALEEAFRGKGAGSKEPAVKAPVTDVQEGAKDDLPSADDLAEALKG